MPLNKLKIFYKTNPKNSSTKWYVAFGHCLYDIIDISTICLYLNISRDNIMDIYIECGAIRDNDNLLYFKNKEDAETAIAMIKMIF